MVSRSTLTAGSPRQKMIVFLFAVYILQCAVKQLLLLSPGPSVLGGETDRKVSHLAMDLFALL